MGKGMGEGRERRVKRECGGGKGEEGLRREGVGEEAKER